MTEPAGSIEGVGSVSDPRVVRAIDLVWREAALLDARQYLAWRDLYADDATYVIPIDGGAVDFNNNLNMVFDDKRMRDLRVDRMTQGYSIAVVDAAKTIRTVSRFVVMAFRGSELELRAAQILIAYKRGRHEIWAGDIDYIIRLGETAEGDRLVQKVIRLIDSDGPVPAAGFLL